MTQTLVDILGEQCLTTFQLVILRTDRLADKDPHPTLKDFMTNLSHAMHSRLLRMHFANKEYKRKKKRWRLRTRRTASPRGDTNGAEISNFQDPQVGASYMDPA